MGEFSETSMPEPEISTDIPDSEPVADIVEDTPPEAEPAPEIVEESPVDFSSVSKTAMDSSFDSEPTGEETADDIVDESSVDAEPNMDTGFDPGLATESVDDIVPESDLDEEPFEESLEIPTEMVSSPEPIGVPRYYDGIVDGQTIRGPEQAELYHSPETTREIEPGTGPNPSWDRPPDGQLNDQYPRETIGEDGWSPDEGKVSSEDLEPLPDEMTEQSESSVTEVGGEDVVDEDIPPEMLNTSPETEQTRLEGEAKSDQLTMPQGGQESKPKFYVDGEELTLPGDGGLEYRIGSPHQDFEDYKGIVDANKQYNIASAAQTSDSLGEAVGTLAAASQEGRDFSEEDGFFYDKYGHAPYTEAAYQVTEGESAVLSASASEIPGVVQDMNTEKLDVSVADETMDTTEKKTTEGKKIVKQIDAQEEVKVEDMQPDTLYERNGYYYRTDEYGRPSGVHAQLELKEGERTDEQTKVGHLGVEDDEGGHLIGTRFNGPTDAFNLVPQNTNLNRGYWKSMENDWASELEKGNDVRVEIQPTYGDASSKRPGFFLVNYIVTNKETGESTPYQQIFFNQSHKE